MSIASVAFGKIVLVMMPITVELSVWIGVGGCGCPISANVAQMTTVCLALINRAPNSALATNDMTALMTFAMLWIVLLLRALLLALALLNYDVSVWIAGIMSLALYVMDDSPCKVKKLFSVF